MKKNISFAQLLCVAASAALFSSCTTTGSSPSAVASTETMLTQAGFTTRAATTAKQKAHVQSLPAGKIAQVKKNGKTFYVYPDPANNRIYVGNQAQYNAYKAARAAQARTSAAAENGPEQTFTTLGGSQVQIYDGWFPFDQI